jgi:hypothetical protein
MLTVLESREDAHAQSIYPVKNPEVPSPPAGYTSTPWIRCSVEIVLDGLRFGDGQIPDDLLALSDGGPSTNVGKVGLCCSPLSGADEVDACCDERGCSACSSPEGTLDGHQCQERFVLF